VQEDIKPLMSLLHETSIETLLPPFNTARPDFTDILRHQFPSLFLPTREVDEGSSIHTTL